MALKYHQATFDLLKIEPEIDPAAVATLDALEQRRGIKLPESVREWYSIKDAATYLTGNDNPVPVQELGQGILRRVPNVQTVAAHPPGCFDRVFGRVSGLPRTTVKPFVPAYRNVLPDDLLLVVIENQGVCYWAVKMDGTDNPPVVIGDEDAANWQHFNDTFSHFCFTRVWDWADHLPYWLEVSNYSITAKIQSALAQAYVEKPASYANDVLPNIYRYGSEQIRILIYLDFDNRAKSWVILMASVPDDILIAAKILFSECDLPEVEWWDTDDADASEQERVLKQIRDWKAGI